MKFITKLIASCLITAPFIVDAANFSVDCNGKIRQATHCANGSLYGIIENTPGDYKSLVDPLHPFVMRNPAKGGPGNQHPYGDAIKVAKRLAQTPGAVVSIDLADILPNWPYKWPGIDGWLNQIKSFIAEKKASGTTNWYGYEIWNEPDGTWKDANGLNFNELWKKTYEVIRQNDPGEKIIGPCDSWYNENRMRSFLQFAKTNNCLPDIMCWHELSGVAGVSPHLRAYRNLEKSLGIKELPISINEYCDAKHELEGQPGSSARFIGKFERYKVDSAMISWWFVPTPGRLGSLLASDTAKGAGWYFYQWYGDMSGDMVNVTPPKDDSDQVDGAACVDAGRGYVSFIFGGPNDGTINTTFKNLPAFVGSSANVKVEKVDWTNKDAPSNGPSLVFQKSMPVTGGQLSVSVPGTNGSSGYRIYITGAGGAAPAQGNNQPQQQPAQQQPQQQNNNNNNQWNQPAQQPQPQQNNNNNQWNQPAQQPQPQQNNNNNQWNQPQPQPQQNNNPAPAQNQGGNPNNAIGGNCAAMWAQCGGNGFNGPTCCSQGTCKQINEYYSQCQ